MLLRHAPPGSAFAASYHGDDWTVTDHLLAEVIDVLGIVASSKRLRDVPKRRPRPGAKAKPRLGDDGVRARFRAIIERGHRGRR